MYFPIYLHLGSFRLEPHLVFQTLAYFAAFRVYVWLRKRRGDAIDDANRWWVIATAAFGAALGSKLLNWFEDPRLTLQKLGDPASLLGGKTIVGALIGGLFAVEWAKMRWGIFGRTGDLFALPLCVGIAIGRIGCFLTGVEEHTAGVATSVPWGVNFGDGIARHPTQLYEVLFVLALGAFLWRHMQKPYSDGDIFKFLMIAYFAFRLLCDFLKPDVRLFLRLSAIQGASLAMLLCYSRDLLRWVRSTKPPAHSQNLLTRWGLLPPAAISI